MLTYFKPHPSFIYPFFIIVLGLSGCLTPPNNDITNVRFENDFLSRIKQDNAQYFDHSKDGLVPQKSYFIANKLKYLQFRHGPEVGFVEGKVILNLATDSIEKYIVRKVLPDFRSENDKKVNDTIFVFYPKRHAAEIYHDNNLIDTAYRRDIFKEQGKYIYELIKSTQNEFKKRHPLESQPLFTTKYKSSCRKPVF